MIKKTVTPIIATLLILIACSDGNSESDSNSRITKEYTTAQKIEITREEASAYLTGLKNNLTQEQALVFDDLAPQMEVYKINPKQENTINTESGAVLSIPSNAFGNVSGEVNIYIMEIHSPLDMIFSGMQTVGNKGWLSSDGMIYINATHGGKKLTLDKGKQILIGLPSKKHTKDASYSVFTGGDVPVDEVVWERSEESEQLNYIIPFPIKYVGNAVIDYYESELGDFHDKIMYYVVDPSLESNETVNKYNWWYYEDLSKYKNSLVVTREYEKMYNSTEGISNHKEVIDYYLERSDMPLWEVDSMYWSEYEKFKNRRHGKVIPLDYDGIDLEENGYEKLKSHGLSEEMSALTMLYYNQRKNLIEEKERELKINYYNSIILRDLGWVNVDKYLDIEAEPLLVNVSVENGAENTIVCLVHEGYKTVVRANYQDGIYFFGASTDQKIRVPEGALIYAFDVIDGAFYAYLSSPMWAEEEVIEIRMREIEKNEIQEFLEFVGR